MAISEITLGERPEGWLIARTGTFYLVQSADHPLRAAEIPRAAARLRDRLEADTRVQEVTLPKLDAAWCEVFRVFPAVTPSSDVEAVMVGSDGLRTARLSSPIAIEVHVPSKNQPQPSEVGDIPAESYRVLWDGLQAMVTWESSSVFVPSPSGGHVVFDILTDAARAAGLDTYQQACSTLCDHGFLHHDLRVHWADDPALDETVRPVEDMLSAVDIEAQDRIEAERRVYYRIAGTVRDFSFAKNSARRILDLEYQARVDLTDVLFMEVRLRDRGGPRHPIDSVRLLAERRRMRREVRRVLTRLWLVIANIEALRRRWSEDWGDFEQVSNDSGVQALFSADIRRDAQMVESLEVDLIRSALQTAEGRSDSRSLVIATACGTVGGGFAGAVAAALLT
jgi:hypothetical protein